MDWREKNDDGGDDIELSLGLQFKSTLQKSPIPFSSSLCTKQPLPSLNGIAPQPSSATSKPNTLLAIDMNNPPMGADTDPSLPLPLSAVSSPDSTVSSESRKINDREENELENYFVSVEGGSGSLTRKKLRLSQEQVTVLEETFDYQSTLSQNQKTTLARQLNLQTRQVEVWFQNRRARTKTRKTFTDCRFLKIQYANLTEENCRLKKEIAELKTLNISPQPYMQTKPSTALSVCPQCKQATVLGKSSPTTSSTHSAEMRARNWLMNRFKESCKEKK